MANRFILNETSYHGAGAIAAIADEVNSRGFQKAFVCSDPDLIQFGVTQKVLDVLEQNGSAYELYSNIKANPTIENVPDRCGSLQSIRCRLHYRDWRRFVDGHRKSHRHHHQQPGFCRRGVVGRRCADET